MQNAALRARVERLEAALEKCFQEAWFPAKARQVIRAAIEEGSK